ncbi:MAG: methyltransferase domain-containing protein [Nanoarchaeota archaeon]
MTYYDDLAAGYNELHGEEQGKKLRLIAEHLKVSAEDSILDIGCGTGLSASFFKGKITGIDPSEGLLKQCPFPTVKGTAENLPFPDHSFDLVLCLTAIHHAENLEKALMEMKRVGKKDWVISVLKKSEKRKKIEESLKTHFKVVEQLEEEKDDIFILQSKNI